MEDSKILELFFARNEDAIRHTDDTYGRRLFALADNIVRNDQDAEESVSDTYMRAWDTIPPQKPQHFFAYLAKICRNFALKKLDWKNAAKRKAEVVSLTQEMEACIPDSTRDREMEAKELGMLLDRFLRTLTPENQMVFLRRYWYVDTIAEIAARYGISESAVQMRLNRTRARLCAYLEKEGIRV
ncbi:MAG: sigma-70 family RNA polymerase sigma factor [Candidatus Faecousia sp.]|nr:sigma-70 family RNA polymerase sigma factor [Candidatus Faecousia sp.]